ncbi:MAG: hypothetical protein V5B38_04340 [Candidatus Accumulibacter propinquus]|jgi:predicted signal transduction protein with EAL and GGDEF domain
MNPIYIAASLTVVLHILIYLGVATWFENTEEAPPGLFDMGLLGQVYKLAIVFTVVASYFSLLGLVIFGDASFLSVVGHFIDGFIFGCVMVFLCKHVFTFHLIFVNLLTPGLLAVGLFMVHSLAWKSL